MPVRLRPTIFAVFAALGVQGAIAAADAANPGLGAALADAETPAPVELNVTAAALDAAHTFSAADANRDGVLDADEYSSRLMVMAQLARFRGSVVIEGETVLHLPLPQSVQRLMSSSERAGIEAVARREFQARTMGAGGLSAAAWQESRLDMFHAADRDGDQKLLGQELEAFVRAQAGDFSAIFPAS